MSTDNGLNWTLTGSSTISNAATIVNAKQAIFLSARNFDGVSFNTDFFYIKKDDLQNPFFNFSVLHNFFTYKMDIVGDKLWAASDNGLFYMPLSALPGITAAEDSVPVTMPVRFISFSANCGLNKVVLTWKTAQEQNSNHFDIEKSAEDIHWTVIGSRAAAGNGNIEKTYFFTDDSALRNNFYRIAAYDQNGSIHYTNTLQTSCNTTDVFRVWPNPVHDKVFINIVSAKGSAAIIKLFDSRGVLVRVQKATVLPGNNQFSTDMKLLANGAYTLSVVWNSGQMNKTIQVVKQ